jgi:hypothetical protein
MRQSVPPETVSPEAPPQAVRKPSTKTPTARLIGHGDLPSRDGKQSSRFRRYMKVANAATEEMPRGRNVSSRLAATESQNLAASVGPPCCLSRHEIGVDQCASRAPVSTETSGLPQTSMDFHGLAGKVLETANHSAAAGLDSRPAWLSGGEGFEPSSDLTARNGFRDLHQHGDLQDFLCLVRQSVHQRTGGDAKSIDPLSHGCGGGGWRAALISLSPAHDASQRSQC